MTPSDRALLVVGGIDEPVELSAGAFIGSLQARRSGSSLVEPFFEVLQHDLGHRGWGALFAEVSLELIECFSLSTLLVVAVTLQRVARAFTQVAACKASSSVDGVAHGCLLMEGWHPLVCKLGDLDFLAGREGLEG